MDYWILAGKGVLFRISALIMVLGLLRAFALSVLGIVKAYKSTEDKAMPWGDIIAKTIGWLIPILKMWKKRPLYSLISVIWHIGLILVPIFYITHANLLFGEGSIWPSLPKEVADLLTLSTVVMGLFLFLGRVFNRNARFLSRFQDIFWPPLLSVAFVTGFLCANIQMSASGYQVAMLIHVLSADLIMILMPFTKVAHCVLLPLSQFVSGVGWKFPRGAGAKVNKTLGKGGSPV